MDFVEISEAKTLDELTEDLRSFYNKPELFIKRGRVYFGEGKRKYYKFVKVHKLYHGYVARCYVDEKVMKLYK
jgi:hypothetical protein